MTKTTTSPTKKVRAPRHISHTLEPDTPAPTTTHSDQPKPRPEQAPLPGHRLLLTARHLLHPSGRAPRGLLCPRLSVGRIVPCALRSRRVARVLNPCGACRLPPPLFFFFNDSATTEIYTLSLHDALPI